VKAKRGYRDQKRQSPWVGNWLTRYAAKRTCRKWKRQDAVRRDDYMPTLDEMLAEKLKDPEFRREWEWLEDEPYYMARLADEIECEYWRQIA
jgi:hypothetical protein